MRHLDRLECVYLYDHCRLLSCAVKEGFNSDCTALVQGSLQGVEALRQGEAERPSVHCEHTTGKRENRRKKKSLKQERKPYHKAFIN